MELSDYRKELDSIDAQMLELFKQRMNTVRGVAEYKKENKLPVLQQGREREILAAAAAGAGEELEDYARTFFATLMDVSRSYQERLTAKGGVISETITNALKNTPPIFPKHGTVACQGVEGAYSQLACDKLFTAPSISYFKNFEGVFAAVEQGLCEYGILPIENSTYGTVNEVYDLMKNYRFHIVRSIKLKVDHSLLVLPGTELKDVKEIFSHEQAIGQCSEFLKAHPGIKVTVCDNTAAAAKMLHESGRHFPGADRISLMLSLPHRPGSLYSLISKFSVLGLNLTKLESRPIAGSDFEFMFYFDIEASVYSPAVLALLDELSDSPELFVFLGSYSEV